MQEGFSRIGVLSGAFLASLCCIGPVVFAALGIGGAGLVVGLEAYRPYLIGFTVAALALAYFFTYRTREVACEDGTCEVRTGSRKSKIMLWTMTGLAAFFIAFPYINWSGNEDVDFTTAGAGFTAVTIPVEGMTCEGCNTAVEMAVGKLDGVQRVKADYTTGEAQVIYDKRALSTNNIIDAINDLGYTAKKPDKIDDGGENHEKD